MMMRYPPTYVGLHQRQEPFGICGLLALILIVTTRLDDPGLGCTPV